MAYARWDCGWWVRVGQTGPGLHALRDDSGSLFSERFGVRRFWRVPFTRWRIRVLGRWRG